MQRLGPVLGQRRRRRQAGGWWQRAALVLALGLAGWLWVVEIGADLRGVRPAASAAVVRAPSKARATPGPADAVAVATEHSGPAAAPAARVAHAGGPRADATPAPRPRPALEPPLDPVRRALLAASRDAVARGVRPTLGSVPDVRALRGSSADLVERALDQLNFSLRAALIAHRVRDPRRHGLLQRAGAGDIGSERVLDVEALTAFLDAFGERLDPMDERALRSGDLLVVTDNRRRGAPQFAIVGEQTDSQGTSLLFTMDPRDRRARADRSGAEFQRRHAFRLTRARLEEARRQLGLGGPAAGISDGVTS